MGRRHDAASSTLGILKAQSQMREPSSHEKTSKSYFQDLQNKKYVYLMQNQFDALNEKKLVLPVAPEAMVQVVIWILALIRQVEKKRVEKLVVALVVQQEVSQKSMTLNRI